MGLTWAVGGALVGFALELVHNIWPNPLGALVDIWPAVLAYPAFFGGLAFSFVLGIAGRHRRFDDLSLARFAAWGAAGGLLASLLPALMVLAGLVSPNVELWRITAGLAVPLGLGGAVAASGTLALARLSEDRELLDEADDVSDVGLTEEETRELLGGGG